MKKSRSSKLILVLLLISTLMLSACSSSTPATQETYEIAYSTWAAEGEPAYEGMVKFKEIVEEKTEGNITIELFPSDQLGSTDEQMEQVTLNTIQMMSSGNPGILELEYLSLPYLMKDVNNWFALLESEVGEQFNEKMIEDKGMRTLGLLPRSVRITSSDREINSPDDFVGMKIRVPERDYYVETFKAFGANPTPINFGETFSALQTGVVQGQENPIETIVAQGFHLVNKYIIMTNHINKPAFVVINEEFYQNLSEEYKTILNEASLEAYDYADSLLEEESLGYVKQMEDEGNIIIEPELAPFIEATQGVRDSLGVEIWGEELYQEIEELGQQDL